MARRGVAHQSAERGSRPEAPIHGVLGEGDRAVGAGTPETARTGSPPLRSPMGRTLFGEAARRAVEADSAAPAGSGPTPDARDLDAIYSPIRKLVQDLRARLLGDTRP